MDKKEILKILNLLKLDKKIKKKVKKAKRKQTIPKSINKSNPVTFYREKKSDYKKIEIPKFEDINKIESEQFSEYKKSRGLLPTEQRGIVPSELELHKEFEKVKKLSKSEIHDLLTDKNIKSQSLERQKYLDKLIINEEKRRIKENDALKKQESKTKTKIVGLRAPKVATNQIIPTINAYSNSDSNGLTTAVGGTSDDFNVVESSVSPVEAPSLISLGGTRKVGRPKKNIIIN